jgi:hypothetical protein
MSEYVVLRGERCVRLQVVAQWYHVEVTFLEEAAELDLLEVAEAENREVVVPEAALDRLAQLLRWHRLTGLGLEELALVLPPPPRR